MSNASLWVDYQFNKANLDGDTLHNVKASERMWTLGFSVGI